MGAAVASCSAVCSSTGPNKTRRWAPVSDHQVAVTAFWARTVTCVWAVTMPTEISGSPASESWGALSYSAMRALGGGAGGAKRAMTSVGTQKTQAIGIG